jgi:DNA modification methylase
MGAGTTGVVALKLGCEFIGIELAEEHYQTARKRLYGVNRDMRPGGLGL